MSNQSVLSIKNVEVSSICNMSCSYCLAPTIGAHRKPGLMSMEVFKEVASKIVGFFNKGTQRELWLHGTGEPLLNKDLVKMIKYLKGQVPIEIFISTNGILIDDQTVTALKEADIKRIDVSCHDEAVAQKAHSLISKCGLMSVLNYGPRKSPFNWAGQIEVEGANASSPSCPWISNQECFVLHDGSIVSCCFDAYGTNILGSITDDLSEIEIKRFELCENCNHTTN